MIKLTDLPTEILGLVCSELPYDSLPCVQSTCRQLRYVVLPKIWENLELDFPSTATKRDHPEKYVKRFISPDVTLFHDPRLYDGHEVSNWMHVKEYDLIRLRKSPQSYQDQVLGYVKRLKIVTGDFRRLERSSEFGYLCDHLIPQLRRNTGFRSIDLGAKLSYYRDPGDALWDNVIAPLAEIAGTEVNLEILSGVLESSHTPRCFRSNVNLRSLKCQVRKCFGTLFDGFTSGQYVLPETLQVFELTSVSHDSSEVVDSHSLRKVLSPCKQLKRLLLKGYFTINGHADWLPTTVADLNIAFNGTINVSDVKPVQAPNVRHLTICRQLIHAVGNYEFPNLEYLQLWDIITQHPDSDREESIQWRNYYIDKFLKLNIVHLDLGEAFHHQLMEQHTGLFEHSYEMMLTAHKRRLRTLVSRDPPLDEVRRSEMPHLEYYILDGSRSNINWKNLVEFLKVARNLKDAYVLVTDPREDRMPKFLSRFVTKYAPPHKKPVLPNNMMTVMFKCHRIMESCVLYRIDLVEMRDAEYL